MFRKKEKKKRKSLHQMSERHFRRIVQKQLSESEIDITAQFSSGSPCDSGVHCESLSPSREIPANSNHSILASQHSASLKMKFLVAHQSLVALIPPLKFRTLFCLLIRIISI